jgi:hypothetical protein
MTIDKSLRMFFAYTLFVFTIIMLLGCSDNDYLMNSHYPKDTTGQNTTLPSNIILRVGESFYQQDCAVNIVFNNVCSNCTTYGINRAFIIASSMNTGSYTNIEFDSDGGVTSYYPNNGTNYVFYFKSLNWINDHYELSITINRYGTL